MLSSRLAAYAVGRRGARLFHGGYMHSFSGVRSLSSYTATTATGCRQPPPQITAHRRFSSSLGDGDDSNSRRSPPNSSPSRVRGGNSRRGVVRTDARIPEQVLVIPVFRRPFFPINAHTVIEIQDPAFTRALQSLSESGEAGNVGAGVFLVKDDFQEPLTDLSQIHTVGSLCSVDSVVAASPTSFLIHMTGLRRVRALSVTSYDDWLAAKIEPLPEEPYDAGDPELKAYQAEVLAAIRDLYLNMPALARQQLNLLQPMSEPVGGGRIADIGAWLATQASPGALQAVMDERNVKERLKKALLLLREEMKVAELQKKVSKDVESKVSKQQQRHFLMEQMKAIKKELGIETDEKQALLDKFRERLRGLTVPDEVMKTIEDEMTKLSSTEPVSSEYNVTRNYLEWLTQLPWGVYSPENFDVRHAERVLDEDHYGLSDVKERILEFIAVGSLKKSVGGKILCLVGPPGVGKTSIGTSIARALGREFFRFSVGGLHDVAEIKGHRRTYVGSMPGKLIQCLKQTKTSNPVVLIDEIDKMSRVSNHGDPASALLEVLDPEQNGTFLDHYLDVPYDLSKVLFVCTANVDETIPGPLLDRMEVIRLSGYVAEEKVEIARRYLIPAALKDSGLERRDVAFGVSAVRALIKSYCREAGVRNLQKQIEKVMRKVALRVARAVSGALGEAEAASDDGGEQQQQQQQQATEKAERAARRSADKVHVTDKNLADFIGKPRFASDRHYAVTPPGVVMGLAWTSMGGATLYVEAVVDMFSGGNKLRSSGQLGDVMKESVAIAHTYAKEFLAEVDASNRFFEGNAVHLHLPEGATPKDGPSAGVTMVTSLLSLALGRSVQPHVAMSGEVTLTGKVLAVGGLKEKTIAARRSGVKLLIFPEANRKDWAELPEHVTKGLDARFVDYYRDVFEIALPSKARKKAAKSKAKQKAATPAAKATVTTEVVEGELLT